MAMDKQEELRNADEASVRDGLSQLLLGYRYSISIYVAAKLGIADLLRDGPRSCGELGRASGANSSALYRMLRVLASVGVFAEDEQGRFALTPSAGLLQTGIPGSIRPWAILIGDLLWKPWAELLYSVKTGQPAFNHVYGMGMFEYLARSPEMAEAFNATMARETTLAADAVISAYDFSEIKTIVDVGGGNGVLIAAILKITPSMRGVLFDLPSVIEEAGGVIKAEGVTERCELVAGDFLKSVPSGGDAYLLKYILHNWDDEYAIAILKNCHSAMNEGGRLLVVEELIVPGNAPSGTKLLDLNMLVLLTGRERTEAEYRALFNSARFRMTRVIPTHSLFSLMEGVRE